MWRLPEKDLEKCLTGLDRLKANEASTADMDLMNGSWLHSERVLQMFSCALTTLKFGPTLLTN